MEISVVLLRKSGITVFLAIISMEEMFAEIWICSPNLSNKYCCNPLANVRFNALAINKAFSDPKARMLAIKTNMVFKMFLLPKK